MTEPNPAVLHEKRDRAFWITINRPDKRNAINKDVVEGIREGYRRAHADPEVRVIVLTGAGAAFCAGGDVKEMTEMRASGEGRSMREKTRPARDDALLAIHEATKPVIAAVNGAAAGAGMNLALAADIRFASTKARFSQAFVKRGLSPDTDRKSVV